MQPVAGQCVLLLGKALAEDGAELGSGLEEPSGLGPDDLQILLLGGLRIAAVQELQHLALGDNVGGVGHDLHDAHVPDVRHHLEGP